MGEERQETSLRLASAASSTPHPAKVATGGEDAWFTADAFQGAVGVADGVSGWAEEGVDPGDYARMFMDACKSLIEQSAAEDFVERIEAFEGGNEEDPQVQGKRKELERKKKMDPVSLLAHGQSRTKILGAATACVALLDRSILRVAHVGDSGARVLRDGKLFGTTTVQQHMFNCPFQLSHEDLVETTDTAEDDAEYIEWRLERGDTVILASDGLFDNLFDADIMSIVNETEEEVSRELAEVEGDPQNALGSARSLSQRIADALVEAAVKKSQDLDYISPFVVEAINQGLEGELLSPWERFLGKKLTGGKMDDVTVVVARVVEDRAAWESTVGFAMEAALESS